MAQGHEGGEECDHEALLLRERSACQIRKRQQKIHQRFDIELALLASLVDAENDSNLGALTLAEIVTEVKKKHAGVLFGRKYAVYAGISKQQQQPWQP